MYYYYYYYYSVRRFCGTPPCHFEIFLTHVVRIGPLASATCANGENRGLHEVDILPCEQAPGSTCYAAPAGVHLRHIDYHH